MDQYFIEVYEKNIWQSNESRSGPGSEKNHPTIQNLIKIVIDLINLKMSDIQELIISDCPCGDFNWINMLLIEIFNKTNIKKINYYGYDIVPNLKNDFDKLNKINNVSYNFNQLDITKNIPNKSDIIICKELFIHLSFNDIKSSLNNFKTSQSSFLICNDFENIENVDITYNNNSLGLCRPVCLTLEPFNLKNYILSYFDYKVWTLIG